MAVRQLEGLRYTREGAGGIIEDLDPMGGATRCASINHLAGAAGEIHEQLLAGDSRTGLQ